MKYDLLNRPCPEVIRIIFFYDEEIAGRFTRFGIIQQRGDIQPEFNLILPRDGIKTLHHVRPALVVEVRELHGMSGVFGREVCIYTCGNLQGIPLIIFQVELHPEQGVIRCIGLCYIDAVIPHATFFELMGERAVQSIRVPGIGPPGPVGISKLEGADLPVPDICLPIARDIDIVRKLSVAVDVVPDRIVIPHDGHPVGSPGLPGDHDMFTCFGTAFGDHCDVGGSGSRETSHTTGGRAIQVIMQKMFQGQNPVFRSYRDGINLQHPVGESPFIFIITGNPSDVTHRRVITVIGSVHLPLLHQGAK